MRAYRQCRQCNAYTTIASGLHEWIQCEWMSFFSDCTIPCIWFNRSFRVLVHWHLSQATCAIAITSNQPTVHPFQRNNHYRFRFPQLDETIDLEKCPAEMTWRNERAKQSVSCHPSAPSRHIMSTILERKKNAIDDCFHTLASQTLDFRLPPIVDSPRPTIQAVSYRQFHFHSVFVLHWIPSIPCAHKPIGRAVSMSANKVIFN